MAAIFLLLGLLQAAPYDWGDRPAVILIEPRPPGAEAAVREIRGTVDKGELVLRLTLDRPVTQAKHLPDGTPVSGRLRAVMYLDSDGDRKTGIFEGLGDLRTGADLRVEVGVVTVGADPDEGRRATALITAVLHQLGHGPRRKTLWRGDEQAHPERIAARGGDIELRLPAPRVTLGERARLVYYVSPSRNWAGQIR